MTIASVQANIKRLLKSSGPIAVAVSGGPDSMALLYMLSHMSGGTKRKIHALTFDHDLREESAAEAQQVAEWVADWPNVTHHILKWKGEKPKSAILEEARNTRYAQIWQWCGKNGIGEIWLGHHQTDQVETFLFRLAKGSGVDGLSGMSERQIFKETGMVLVRPMLNISKVEIERFCAAKNIPFVRDPSNHNMKFARARLRRSLPILEEEGLSEDRLARTIHRMARATEALDFYAGQIIRRVVIVTPREATIKLSTLIRAPADIRIRVIRRVLAEMGGDGYGPRLDRLEQSLDLFFVDLKNAKSFTLGGYLFKHRVKQGMLVITPEKASRG